MHGTLFVKLSFLHFSFIICEWPFKVYLILILVPFFGWSKCINSILSVSNPIIVQYVCLVFTLMSE